MQTFQNGHLYLIEAFGNQLLRQGCNDGYMAVAAVTRSVQYARNYLQTKQTAEATAAQLDVVLHAIVRFRALKLELDAATEAAVRAVCDQALEHKMNMLEAMVSEARWRERFGGDL